MKVMDAQIKHETFMKNIAIKLTKQKSKQLTLTNEINAIQCALQEVIQNQENQEKQENEEQYKFILSMIDQYKLYKDQKVDCKTIGNYHMELSLKKINDEQLNLIKQKLEQWAELRKSQIQCNLKISNQQTQLEQLEKLIAKPNQTIQSCSTRLNKILSAQRLIKQFTSEFNQEDINQEIHQQLLFSQIYPDDDMEFWSNLNLLLKSYLLSLQKDNKQISQIEQIQSRLAIAVTFNEQLQQQQQQIDTPYNFPQHRPDYFSDYTQFDHNSICQGFCVWDELYIFDQDGGWCDYNGCYYDKDCKPDGWYRTKKGDKVVRYSNDRKEEFEVELAELKWLEIQINARRQGIWKPQAKEYFKQKFKDNGILNEWRLIKETLQLETMGITIGR